MKLAAQVRCFVLHYHSSHLSLSLSRSHLGDNCHQKRQQTWQPLNHMPFSLETKIETLTQGRKRSTSPTQWKLITCLREHLPVLVMWGGGENETGSVHILAIFQDRPVFSHINGKLPPRLFALAEHRSVLKNYQYETIPVLVTHPRQLRTPL